jgi:hypothetical protein
LERCGFIGDPTTGDVPKRAMTIDWMLKKQVHSVRVEFTWRDQGWGHQKGQVYLVGAKKEMQEAASDNNNTTESSSSNTNNNKFDDGRVVYASPVSPHANTRVVFWFTPQQEEEYALWYKVGSGGGHTLNLSNASIQLFVQDDSEWNIRNNHQALVDANVIPIRSGNTTESFYPQLFMTLVRSLLAQYERKSKEGSSNTEMAPAAIIDPLLLQFLQEHNLRTTRKGLKIVLEILMDSKVLFDTILPPLVSRPSLNAPNPVLRTIRIGRLERNGMQRRRHHDAVMEPQDAHEE